MCFAQAFMRDRVQRTNPALVPNQVRSWVLAKITLESAATVSHANSKCPSRGTRHIHLWSPTFEKQ